MVGRSRQTKKFCPRCGKGTVKPDRVACKQCGSTEWGGNATETLKQNAPAQSLTPTGAESNPTSDQAVVSVKVEGWRWEGGCVSGFNQIDVRVVTASGQKQIEKRYTDFLGLKCIFESCHPSRKLRFPPRLWLHRAQQMWARCTDLEQYVNELLCDKSLYSKVIARLETFLDPRLCRVEPEDWILQKRRPQEKELNTCEECGCGFQAIKLSAQPWKRQRCHCDTCLRVFCKAHCPKRGVVTVPRTATAGAVLGAGGAAMMGADGKCIAAAAATGAVLAPVLGPSTDNERKCKRCHKQKLERQ